MRTEKATLRRAVRGYVDHYHGERNYQGIGNRLIASKADGLGNGSLERRGRLGGLLRYDCRAA